MVKEEILDLLYYLKWIIRLVILLHLVLPILINIYIFVWLEPGAAFYPDTKINVPLLKVSNYYGYYWPATTNLSFVDFLSRLNLRIIWIEVLFKNELVPSFKVPLESHFWPSFFKNWIENKGEVVFLLIPTQCPL